MTSPIGQLPAGWQLVPLGELTTHIGSGATPRGGSAVYLNQRINYALVRSQNVFDRFFNEEGLAYISDSDAVALRGVELQENDVLLNITGDGITFGRSCLVPVRILPACVNQHVVRIRCELRKCAPGYLLSFLTHPLAKEYIESFNAGGSRRAITKGYIESFIIPLPPLTEQQAIACILGALDDKIELNRRMNRTLEGLARALFQSWFVDFDPVRAKAAGQMPPGLAPQIAKLFPAEFVDSELGEIPQGWQISCLGDVVEKVAMGPFGSSIKRDNFVSDGVPVIRGGNLTDGFVDDGFVFLLESKADELRNANAFPGDIVITHRGTLGQIGLIPAKALYKRYVVSQSQMLVRACWESNLASVDRSRLPCEA